MGDVNKSRLRAAPVLLTAMVLAPAALAQSAPSTPARPASTAQVSDAVFQKSRPATFQLEWRAPNDTTEPDGLGTGYFISEDGLALTAYHVVFGAPKLSARLSDNQRLPVEVIGFDDYNDIALVRVGVKGKVPFLPLAKTAPAVGDAALAIGNSGSRFLAEKRGTLRRLGVDAGRADFPSNTLELDAPLRPGDSGGPIINAAGEAIGVVSYIRATGQNSAGRITWLSYAIPVTQDSSLVRDLRAGVKRDAPVIGIELAPAELDAEDFPKYGLGPKAGIIVNSVREGGPGEKAGLRSLVVVRPARTANDYPQLRADVILEVDGKQVLDYADLLEQVRGRKIGDTVTLTVQRGNEVVRLSLQLGSRASIFGTTP